MRSFFKSQHSYVKVKRLQNKHGTFDDDNNKDNVNNDVTLFQQENIITSSYSSYPKFVPYIHV